MLSVQAQPYLVKQLDGELNRVSLIVLKTQNIKKLLCSDCNLAELFYIRVVFKS